mmetsp:Transcript_158/g.581  ORF Transcript_158/g.581 Transcript_158/m.581 type:complete len:432 (+) Transcript_158:1150-2445(+)
MGQAHPQNFRGGDDAEGPELLAHVVDVEDVRDHPRRRLDAADEAAVRRLERRRQLRHRRREPRRHRLLLRGLLSMMMMIPARRHRRRHLGARAVALASSPVAAARVTLVRRVSDEAAEARDEGLGRGRDDAGDRLRDGVEVRRDPAFVGVEVPVLGDHRVADDAGVVLDVEEVALLEGRRRREGGVAGELRMDLREEGRVPRAGGGDARRPLRTDGVEARGRLDAADGTLGVEELQNAGLAAGEPHQEVDRRRRVGLVDVPQGVVAVEDAFLFVQVELRREDRVAEELLEAFVRVVDQQRLEAVLAVVGLEAEDVQDPDEPLPLEVRLVAGTTVEGVVALDHQRLEHRAVEPPARRVTGRLDVLGRPLHLDLTGVDRPHHARRQGGGEGRGAFLEAQEGGGLVEDGVLGGVDVAGVLVRRRVDGFLDLDVR